LSPLREDHYINVLQWVDDYFHILVALNYFSVWASFEDSGFG